MKVLRQAPFILIFFCVLFCCGAFCSQAVERPQRDVRAGVFNFLGYHDRDEDGSLQGYGMDLLDLISQYSDLNFIFTGYDKSWQDMQDMLERGELDIVSTARRTPRREEIFAFSLPVGRNNTVLSKNVTNTRLRAGDYGTYNGMKVGVVAGSSQNQNLEGFARDKGFTYTMVEFESPVRLAEALRNGEVDAVLSSNLRKRENETVLDVIKSDNFYIIASKENQDLIDEINYAIEQMNLNEGDWQNDIYYRHYGPKTSFLPNFSRRENEFIAEVGGGGKKIIATAMADNPPYSFVEEGKLKGVLLDYFAKVMEIANLPYTVVPQNKDEGNSGIEAVVLDSLEPLEARENAGRQGFMTPPYLNTSVARVTRVDFNSQPASVALPESTPFELQPGLLHNVERKFYPTPVDALEAVRKGEVDAAYVLPYTAQYYVNHNPDSGLFFTLLNDGEANFRLFVPPEADHELTTILKKAVKRVPPGTLNQLATKYISFDAEEVSLFHYLHANPEVLFGSALALILAASLLLMMWMRGRWNKRILAATEDANQILKSQLFIVEALSKNYSNVLAINPENGATELVKFSDPGANGDEEKPEHMDYETLLENYIDEYVYYEDRDYVGRALALPTALKELQDRDEYSGTYRVCDDGDIKYFQFTFVRPDSEDEGDGDLILMGIKNIDDVIRREQEQKEALAQALEQSRSASAAKTAFLNNMSHDIRTPMNAIIGFTNLAVSNVTNITLVRRYLGKIMTSGNHLLSLINDVLDMSRIESGKVKLDEQELSLSEILHDLRTITQADVRARQLDFQMETQDVVNEKIYCDRLRLNQILLNILSNAIKYTRPGGKVSMRVVQVTPVEEGTAVYEFHVADTGIGMSEEFLKHVFEPFEREQTATVSGIQGTGLGLAITKNIVDIMGGSIEVASEPGEGSEFTLRFRFRVPEDWDYPAPLEEYAGMRALVVDDDINTCTSLCSMLSELGLRADWTTLGKEALVRAKFAADYNEPYNLYFIDWMLSDMDGLALARRLRKFVPGEVPFYVFTPYDWGEVEEEEFSGATEFYPKPIFISDMRNILLGHAELAESGETESDERPNFTGRRILLAEDNEMNQEIAQMILEEAGFELDIVENGQMAVDKIVESEAGHYDLILMDVQMPVMDGYEATRVIRAMKDPVKSAIPIIAMTANAFDEDREEAINSGMNGYVAKPIDVDKLMATLEETIIRFSL